MKINIVGRGLRLDQATRQHIERRLQFALGRFATEVTAVHLTLADENGPKRGVDKRIRLRVDCAGLDGFVIDRTGSDWQFLVDGAADRAGRAVARALDRRRDRPEQSYSGLPVSRGEDTAAMAPGVYGEKQ